MLLHACLGLNQAIEEDVLCELEEMERLCDIDDILSYRSAAEREIKDLLATSLSSRGSNGANLDMSLEDERPSNKPRGWLNWLSRGMLGAGGTDDSSQFSGVISDDAIKDIYEATKFRPAPSMNEDAAKADEVFLSSIKFNIHQFTFTLQSVRLGRAIAHLMLDSVSTECKIWERYTGITATINAVQLFNPFNNQVILMTKINTKENELDIEPSVSIQVEVLPRSCEVSSSVKVNLQPIEVKCDTRFLMDNLEFFYIFGNFKFQQERVKNDDGLCFLSLDFQLLKSICQIKELYGAMEENPKDALLCLSAAVHKVLMMKWDSNMMEEFVKINIRLHNYPESLIALKNLKAAYIDRLVSVHGTVVKVSTVRPLVRQMCFVCTKCGTNITCNFPDGKFSPPSICELLKNEHHEEGRVPRTVECELTEDLVDACIPGDIVTVTGIIRMINNYMDIGGGKVCHQLSMIDFLLLFRLVCTTPSLLQPPLFK
ncbi:unnamed protein product [Coffea canephora]|uniref:MCM OB domain-containing protein n=1 Tax=Coffea canephora TaxID=49390 RepID=A0A068V8A5_COFCA|nr:unnamed protein product [Coffea canephora]